MTDISVKVMHCDSCMTTAMLTLICNEYLVGCWLYYEFWIKFWMNFEGFLWSSSNIVVRSHFSAAIIIVLGSCLQEANGASGAASKISEATLLSTQVFDHPTVYPPGTK